MKKITLFIFSLLLFIPLAHAGECHDVTDVNDYWVEITSGVNIRDQVCDGNVIGTLSGGTKVKVTGHIEDWRYIERPDGGVGFVWSDFVQNTAPPATQKPKEALYDISGHQYEEAIRYLAEGAIVKGYPDGSYQPERPVNRAEFTKILVEAKLGGEPSEFEANCFPDVKASGWFSSYVCYAKEMGIIGGYSDNTFKPGNNINLAEASKILINTLEIDRSTHVGGEWYEEFISSMQNQNYIPSSFSSVSQLVNRSQMAEMIYRIQENLRDRPSKVFNFSSQSEEPWINPNRPCIDEELPASIDMDVIRNAWLSWHNEARQQRGLSPLTSNAGLDYTSSVWATSNKNLGELTHNRAANQDASEWFTANGITFKEKSGKIFGENLGFRTYRCSDSDCTQEALDSARYIFDAFMAEEGTDDTGHYDNIVESDFVEEGLGIAIDFDEETMYLTTQYSFGVESHIPVKHCSSSRVSKIPEVNIEVSLPEEYTVIKNNEENRRGSFVSYDFNIKKTGNRPFLKEIQFFSKDSLKEFIERCSDDSPCFYGDAPSLERYNGQKEAFGKKENYENYELRKFGESHYFVSNFKCVGDICSIREYTTFIDDTKVDVWFYMGNDAMSAQADELFKAFTIIE